MNKLAENLVKRGAVVHIGHDAAQVGEPDVVVYSSSIAMDNVELLAAKEKGIPVLHRSQMLARLLNDKRGLPWQAHTGKRPLRP